MRTLIILHCALAAVCVAPIGWVLLRSVAPSMTPGKRAALCVFFLVLVFILGQFFVLPAVLNGEEDVAHERWPYFAWSIIALLSGGLISCLLMAWWSLRSAAGSAQRGMRIFAAVVLLVFALSIALGLFTWCWGVFTYAG